MFTRYLLPLAAVLAAVFAFRQMTLAQQKAPPVVPPVEPGKSPFAKQLAGAGLVEPESENIGIGSHVPGVVDEVLVKVGQTVQPGTPLFRLDDRNLQAELAVRNATLASAKATVAKLDQMPRPEELPPLKAKEDEAAANLRDQELMLARVRKAGATAVSEEEISRREMGVIAAQAMLAKATADYALTKAGAWSPDKLVSRAAVAQAEAQVNQTKTELTRLSVLAPRAPSANATYTVLQVNVRAGEYVGNTPNQPLVVLGCVGRQHVRVDIDENDIARFRANLPGVAKPRGNPEQTVPLSFVRVEPYVIPKKSLTGGNSERVDTRVLQVIYALDPKPGEPPLFVGQQMDVFLDAGAK